MIANMGEFHFCAQGIIMIKGQYFRNSCKNYTGLLVTLCHIPTNFNDEKIWRERLIKKKTVYEILWHTGFFH